ncbi:YciI family protein [Sphingopyxis sp. PET50]|uniref:YciI family protein n=1 Tax=Sphingopyxis sp. PET50 TaxID=2976533 RepID=UPI0021AF03D7|nr:YciI family protein [Sphingopyxis sp. PET50]
MFLVALCADSNEAPALRPALLAEHGAYLRSLDCLRFSAPLARRDDALVTGEGLESSVIILEGEDWDGLLETLLADPYATGGVWARIDFYELKEQPNIKPGAHLVDLTTNKRWYFRLEAERPHGRGCHAPRPARRLGGTGHVGCFAGHFDVAGRRRMGSNADI